MNLILLLLVCQTGDETVLATAERLFLDGNLEAASEMIASHSWASDSLWSSAGLVGELCSGGFSFPLEPFTGVQSGEYQVTVQVEFSYEAVPADSLRLFIPVPAELPWQSYASEPCVIHEGIQGECFTENGWLVLEGVAQGRVSALFTVPVSVSCGFFTGTGLPGIEEAMVCFPGEDDFMDRCLNTDLFWAGGDRVYLESVRLARAEPNPMRLAERIQDRISGFTSGTEPVDQRILHIPSAEIALDGELKNSLGGVFLGASILRRWQIPAIPAPGRFASGSAAGFVLFVHIKPFGWMALSPLPQNFIAVGSSEPPVLRSWASGVPGLTVFAERRGENPFWHAIPVTSDSIGYRVEFTLH